MKKIGLLILSIAFSLGSLAQEKLQFNGQATAIISNNFTDDLNYFNGNRYIGKLAYKIPVTTNIFFDFKAEANTTLTNQFNLFDSLTTQKSLNPYRLSGRYSSEQYEIRVGLQKIDFGSASLLRPLQWLNQIDFRDPLQITNGVYGVLGRYYLLNNANIWLWGLYGNTEQRGFDTFQSKKEIPELGGRIQYPTPKGELALSYHHRAINTPIIDNSTNVKEHKIGFDGKWDLKVGFWIEASHSYKSKNIGNLTNQTLINIGSDYTFGIGNGLRIIGEHLISSYNQEQFNFENKTNTSALTVSYPLSIFDNISTIAYQNWEQNNTAFFLNYEHHFKYLTAYIMGYYTPSANNEAAVNEQFNNFTNSGIRLMFVYNH